MSEDVGLKVKEWCGCSPPLRVLDDDILSRAYHTLPRQNQDLKGTLVKQIFFKESWPQDHEHHIQLRCAKDLAYNSMQYSLY